jgi:hypothetical protein
MQPNGQSKELAALAVMLVAALEALAQETARPPRRVVVSVPDRKLALLEGDRVLKLYPIAVGAAKSPTPAGAFAIVHRIPDPTWYTRGKIVPPGAANPLGTRWLGLSVKGYGIHGTNNPGSIGKRASRGCIRMRNADVEELFDLLETGDPVAIASDRTPEILALFAPPRRGSEASIASRDPEAAVVTAMIAPASQPADSETQ